MLAFLAGSLTAAMPFDEGRAQPLNNFSFMELVLGARNAQKANDCTRFEAHLAELTRRSKSILDEAGSAHLELKSLQQSGCGGRVYTSTDQAADPRFSTFPASSIFSRELWHDGGGFSGGVGGEVTGLPDRQFFGFNQGGLDHLGGFLGDSRVERFNFSGGVQLPSSSGTYNRFTLSLSTGDASRSGSFTPPGGSSTLIPGSTGGASGAFLGGAPSIEDINWSWDQTDIAFWWQHGFRRNVGSGRTVGAHFKLGYGLTDIVETISGEVPLFTSSFRQSGDILVHQIPALVGVNFSQQVPLANGGNLTFHGYGKAGVTYLHGSGSHHTEWSGFIAGIIDNSSARFSESNFGFTYQIGGGFNFDFSPSTTLGFGAWFGQRQLPAIELNGTDPAQINFHDVNYFGAVAKFTAKLP
jgi:hypothetical protein